MKRNLLFYAIVGSLAIVGGLQAVLPTELPALTAGGLQGYGCACGAGAPRVQ